VSSFYSPKINFFVLLFFGENRKVGFKFYFANLCSETIYFLQKVLDLPKANFHISLSIFALPWLASDFVSLAILVRSFYELIWSNWLILASFREYISTLIGNCLLTLILLFIKPLSLKFFQYK